MLTDPEKRELLKQVAQRVATNEIRITAKKQLYMASGLSMDTVDLEKLRLEIISMTEVLLDDMFLLTQTQRSLMG